MDGILLMTPVAEFADLTQCKKHLSELAKLAFIQNKLIIAPVRRGTLHARKGLLRRLTMQHKVIEFFALAATGAAFGALLAWGAFL